MHVNHKHTYCKILFIFICYAYITSVHLSKNMNKVGFSPDFHSLSLKTSRISNSIFVQQNSAHICEYFSLLSALAPEIIFKRLHSRTHSHPHKKVMRRSSKDEMFCMRPTLNYILNLLHPKLNITAETRIFARINRAEMWNFEKSWSLHLQLRSKPKEQDCEMF